MCWHIAITPALSMSGEDPRWIPGTLWMASLVEMAISRLSESPCLKHEVKTTPDVDFWPPFVLAWLSIPVHRHTQAYIMGTHTLQINKPIV